MVIKITCSNKSPPIGNYFANNLFKKLNLKKIFRLCVQKKSNINDAISL